MAQHAILNKDQHRELRIRIDAAAELGDAVMSAITVPNEFRRVQNEYPILFRRDLERDRFTALALFGFETGENLFLRDGKWDARYRPLAQAIQPFLIGRPRDGDGSGQVHVDLDHARIADGGEGMRVFDEDGRPTPYLESIAEMLGALDEGYRASGDFFDALKKFDLLEPFSLEVELADGARHRLVGYHLIDEERLRALGPGELGELHAAGHLMPIFMALASLSNIGALVARKNRLLGHG